MRWIAMLAAGGFLLFLARPAGAAIPNFKVQEIDKSLKIGYAVSLVDINGDGKPDIVVVDKDRVIWFENPTWALRTIMSGQKSLDNVCLDPYDIDGDGKVDLALGAGWRPGNTKEPSTLQWYRRGKTLDEPWQEFKINYEEPTLHRMRWADLDGTGKKVLVTMPLTGPGSTNAKNWSEAGVRMQIRHIPADPTQADWPTELITDRLHVPHNFQVINVSGAKRPEILVASYEGVSLLSKDGQKWDIAHLGEGDQSKPNTNRGSSEIKLGKLKSGTRYIGTIEPWHGNKVVVYTQQPGQADWHRQVLDDQLLWGHAVWCADLDGDGDDELVIGVRDPMKDGSAKSGSRVYKATDPTGQKWEKAELDPGGVAVEDQVVGDLNGDGRPDIVAVGRATKNVRIYWNEGK
ncbi:MAG TPA: VCBS repeat-containing protein [Tepidisphaeraceae bacterium]|jgi:hypothetical protein